MYKNLYLQKSRRCFGPGKPLPRGQYNPGNFVHRVDSQISLSQTQLTLSSAAHLVPVRLPAVSLENAYKPLSAKVEAVFQTQHTSAPAHRKFNVARDVAFHRPVAVDRFCVVERQCIAPKECTIPQALHLVVLGQRVINPRKLFWSSFVQLFIVSTTFFFKYPYDRYLIKDIECRDKLSIWLLDNYGFQGNQCYSVVK